MLWISLACLMMQSSHNAVQVTIDTRAAESVFAILDTRQANEPVPDELWTRLFDTEGYRRLKKREASMDSAFEDEEFREFVLSPELLSRRRALRETLDDWGAVDVEASAERVLRYLPQGARIHATIYPMIKSRSNSFVFELDTDPAIFFYLNPTRSASVFENILAHELHHVGLAAACSGDEADEAKDEKVAEVRRWIGAFGEGLAMLAAAGGPDVHPHRESPQEERERWDRDVRKFDRDLQRVEQFFLDILDGRLAGEDERLEVARSFYGIQGPWYTVGWQMAVTIERAYGRERLISLLCDPVEFLTTYNEAAREGDAQWDPTLLERIADDQALLDQ